MSRDYLLHLNYIFHDYPKRIHLCLNKWPTYEAFLAEAPTSIDQGPGSDKTKQYWRHRFQSYNHADYDRALTHHQITVTTIQDSQYPTLFTQLPTPPVVLYSKGNRHYLHTPCFAVVGTRQPTVYGTTVTKQLTRHLSHHFTIVSGMAKGVDTIAHTSALAMKQPTIAVLGTGLDCIYPAQNTSLFNQLCETGLVISEQPLGIDAKPYRFPQRNRLISGLSSGTLITEAGERSGASITANFALDQGRNVYAVPGHIGAEMSVGPHRLIQDGAKLVHSIEDILIDYHSKSSNAVATPESTPSDLSPEEEKIIACISHSGASIDYLCAHTGMSYDTLLHYISILEVNQHIQKEAGNRYVCT